MSALSLRSPSLARILTISIFMMFFALSPAKAQTYKVLFNAEAGSGVENPASHIVSQGIDGSMYFTSPNGGTFYGTFFKVAPSGAAAVVNPVEGFPVGGSTLGTDGNFYVTNQDEGPGGNCGFSGCGQILKITPSGVSKVLYNFTGEGDGSDPQGSPIQASNGIFYGATVSDGVSDGSSITYSITSGGKFKHLHTFSSSEGQSISGELLQASDGNLYGMATYGGANGRGSIFRMTLSGAVTVLHSFDGTDGSGPCCGLVEANDGSLYGAAAGGGQNSNGVIFKLTLAGTYTVIYNLNYANGDGTGPGSTLTQGSDGLLYGVTASGGSGANGTLFSVTTAGEFKTLYTLCASGSCTDGYGPSSPLKQYQRNFLRLYIQRRRPELWERPGLWRCLQPECWLKAVRILG